MIPTIIFLGYLAAMVLCAREEHLAQRRADMAATNTNGKGLHDECFGSKNAI